MVRPLLKTRVVIAAVFALACVTALSQPPAATAFTFGSVAGEIDDWDGFGLANYPYSIRYNQLLYGAPVITTKSASGGAMRRVRVSGIITKVRVKVAYNGTRSFKFSIWQPDNSDPRYPGTSCRNNASPQEVAVTLASPDCVMEARMTKLAEINFIRETPWRAEDPARSRFNLMGFGYSRVYTQPGPGAGRPTIYTFANARARVEPRDWLSVAPVESSPQVLQAWRSGSSLTLSATNNVKMAANGGLCMHGSFTPQAGLPRAPGGEQPFGLAHDGWPTPIETGELNVGMLPNQNPVDFSPCYPSFQYEGYRAGSGRTGAYYGNCHPGDNFRYPVEQLDCHRRITNAMQVEYTIESDGDHDGWGDQTQGAFALRERAWLAADAERRAREAAAAAAREAEAAERERLEAEAERLAELARRWRIARLGVDVGDLLREGATLNVGEIDFNLGGIAPGAQPGQSPADANPALDPPGAPNGANNPPPAGPQLTLSATTRREFGSGAIAVRIRCPKERCQLVAEATMRSRARGAERTRSDSMLRASYIASRVGRSKTMFVKLSAANRRKLRRAWNKRAALSARVTVSAVNAAGGVTQKTITVKIRRHPR